MSKFTILARSSEETEDWDIFEILLNRDDDSEAIANCYSEEWAQKILSALRWLDAMEETGMMPVPKPKKRPVKTKKLHEEESDL